VVTDTLAKYGGRVRTARRWDERRLAFSIRGRRRGTYLLAYYELEAAGIPAMRRDLDLSERVLRYLIMRADGVPDAEVALSAAENAADFVVPEPPPDDAPEEREADDDEAGGRPGRDERRRGERADSGRAEDSDDDAEAAGAAHDESDSDEETED